MNIWHPKAKPKVNIKNTSSSTSSLHSSIADDEINESADPPPPIGSSFYDKLTKMTNRI